MAHTQVLNPNSILFGSALVEIAPYDTGVFVSIGAADGVKFSFKPKFEVIEFDNVEVWRKYANADEASIAGTWYELSAANIKRVLGGMATLTNEPAGAPITVTDEPVKLTGTAQMRLAKRNGNGSLITISNCDSAAGAGGTSFTLAGSVTGGDYAVSTDAQGYTCIARTADSDIPTGTVVYVTYQYTPNAYQTIDVGGVSVLDFVKVRLTNRRPSDQKDFVITCHKATIDGDLGWTFGKDGNLKPLGSPFTFKAIKDTTAPEGSQLFRIKDEQSVVA